MTTIDQKFLVERQGKTFALYAGLLDAAHRDGLKTIRTELVQLGHPDNADTWIVHATVETERGAFSGIGDASPANVAKQMLHCLPRMAETRAKARALRDAVNAGALVALEELGGDSDDQSAPRPVVENPTPRPTPTTDAPASDAQRRAVVALARKRGVDLQRAGVDVDNLSRTQASTLIERWQKEVAAV